jgi:prophage regulatory protein
LHPEQRLKLQQVSALTGKGRTKIYAEIKAGAFPAPERDGPRWSRWRAADVLAYLAAKRVAA